MHRNQGLERARRSGSQGGGREAAGRRRAGCPGSMRGPSVNFTFCRQVFWSSVIVSARGWAGAAWVGHAGSTNARRVRMGGVGRQTGRCALRGARFGFPIL